MGIVRAPASVRCQGQQRRYGKLPEKLGMNTGSADATLSFANYGGIKVNDTRLDGKTRKALSQTLQVLEVFRDIDPTMQLGAAVGFVHVALEEGISVSEMAHRVGVELSSGSRYQQYFGKVDRARKPGKDLMSDPVDPNERRRKMLRLTPKGQRIVSKLETVLEGL